MQRERENFSMQEGYDEEIVVHWLETATQHFGRRRVWNDPRTRRTGNVPQSTGAVQGAGQQTIIE